MKQFGDFGFIAGQISEETLVAAKDAGVTLVVQHRPDGEAPGQPSSMELAIKATELGLQYKTIDIKPGELSVEKIEAMAEAVQSAEGKILSFCAAGGRAASMLSLGLARSQKADPETLIALAAQAGQDLSGLQPLLTDVHRA